MLGDNEMWQIVVYLENSGSRNHLMQSQNLRILSDEFHECQSLVCVCF